MVTMKKIAELCGVSRGTVDRALNGRGRVNPETAEAIRSMAKQLGYEPNPAGKALAARRNKPVIGVVLASQGNAFFDVVLDGMKAAAAEYEIYGVTVQYYALKGYQVGEQLAVLQKIAPSIQALIINPVNDPVIARELDAMIRRGIFVIAVNNDIEGVVPHCYVGCDYFNSGVTSCALLAALTGASAEIGIILGSRRVMGHKMRLEGFRRHMERIPSFHVQEIVEHEDDDINAFAKVKELLDRRPTINALVILAAGVYGTCRAVMQLPEGKRPLVVACDTVPTTVQMMEQGIVKATLYQHPFRQGATAVTLAFEYLVHGKMPTKERYEMKNEIKLFENL